MAEALAEARDLDGLKALLPALAGDLTAACRSCAVLAGLYPDAAEAIAANLLGTLAHAEKSEDPSQSCGEVSSLAATKAGLKDDDIELMKERSYMLTQSGKYSEALALDKRIAEACPEDPLVFYNLACSYSLTGQIDDSLTAIARALELGYADLPHMLKDGDLENARGDSRFQQLLEKHRS